MANGPWDADRIRDTSTTTGTGSFTLAGSPPTGYGAFSAIPGVADGDLVCYAIGHQAAAEWETGIGTISGSQLTLARTYVQASSNSGAAVSFSAGSKDVFVGPAAARLGYLPKCFPVPQSGWTWDNQGSATLSLWGSGCRSVYCPAGSSADQLRVQYRTLPAAPYKVEMGLMHGGANATNYSGAFAGWRSSGGTFRGVLMANEVASFGFRYTSFSSSSAGRSAVDGSDHTYYLQAVRGPVLYLRFEDDNTNQIVSVGGSGAQNDWVKYYSETRGTGMTAAQLAFGIWTYDRDGTCGLVHYREY